MLEIRNKEKEICSVSGSLSRDPSLPKAFADAAFTTLKSCEAGLFCLIKRDAEPKDRPAPPLSLIVRWILLTDIDLLFFAHVSEPPFMVVGSCLEIFQNFRMGQNKELLFFQRADHILGALLGRNGRL